MLLAAFFAQYLQEKSDTSSIVELLQAKGHSGFTVGDQSSTFNTICEDVTRMWNL